MRLKGIVTIALSFMLAVAAISIAGCHQDMNWVCPGPDDSSCYEANTPQPVLYCPYPSGNPPQLVFPPSGAAGVSVNTDTLILADSAMANYSGTPNVYAGWLTPVGNAYDADFGSGTPADRATSAFLTIPAAQLPSGAVEPTIASPIYAQARILYGPLSPDILYYLYMWEITTGPNEFCSANGPIASFTTGPATSTATTTPQRPGPQQLYHGGSRGRPNQILR